MAREFWTSTSLTALLFLAQLVGVAAGPASSVRHVFIVVWDGMRPDFVTQENTPTLWKLSHEGVAFRNHHAVYPSATNVNGTALVTGMYPNHSGIMANHVYRPEIDNRRSIDVETPAVVQKGDKLSSGKYIAVPTVAELVQRAGGRTAIASAKTVGLLLDRQADPMNAKGSITLFAGDSRPRDAIKSIVSMLGPFPSDHSQQDVWTTKSLTDFLWKDGVPTLSILWLAEPDLTQHESAPGAPVALAAIRAADQNLASALSALDQHHVRETTDVFVVSDHGFSTIERSVDLRKILNDAGFAAKTDFSSEPKAGEIMLAGNGGSVLFYVVEHDTTVTRRLVEFLQQSDFGCVIFTKEPLDGTFVLEQAKIDNQYAPDVVMAFQWNDSNNQFGVPGMIDADWQRRAGQGTHATLSRFDMHNMLIAAGPDFSRGYTDDLPTGNIDLAPTILRILRITMPHQLDGRILSEAMTDIRIPRPGAETKTIEATKDFPSGNWRQSLQISRVSSTIYLDEGGGAFVPKNSPQNDVHSTPAR
jgi:arylsulfatase A-like enzyme